MIKELSFLGKSFKIFYMEKYGFHPTWYTFEDETNIRNDYWHIKPGDTVLDIGACCGSYVLTALSQGARFVWAWAPGFVGQDSEIDILRTSLAANEWENKGKVYNTGLYNKDGFLDVDTQVFSTSHDLSSQIRVETLDGWAESNLSPADKIDWVKIDTEGAEIEILLGGINIIRKFKPKLIVENHLFRRSSIGDEAKQILCGVGYNEVARITHPVHPISHSVYLPV